MLSAVVVIQLAENQNCKVIALCSSTINDISGIVWMDGWMDGSHVVFLVAAYEVVLSGVNKYILANILFFYFITTTTSTSTP